MLSKLYRSCFIVLSRGIIGVERAAAALCACYGIAHLVYVSFFYIQPPPPQVWLFFFCQACQTHSRKLSWRQRIQGNAAITVPSFADAKQDILQERKASSVPLHNKQRQITWTWSKLTDLGSPHSSLPPNRFLLKQSRLVLFATVV